jgi:aspartyl-tRNA(Asn)/glutamyl-tRNA(Gln) amidotransferase subunit B
MSPASVQPRPVSPAIFARYEAVIGLEVHVRLLTKSKIFCGCSTRFGDPPNAHTCPVCLGLPGSLPVLNRSALDLALRAALALHLEVQPVSRFARKNYFYPDLPKGYQISQYELPLARQGWLEIETPGSTRRIGIVRLHLEEDAAKTLHEGFPDSDTHSYIDFNRCGAPLVEIVSAPELRSPGEAHVYLTALKQVLRYAEVSDCNMEEGSLRCDANVSIRLRGEAALGPKVELKNLNSFRHLERALEFEVRRQAQTLEAGGEVEQETRLWNVSRGRTEPMRSKEFAHDYRYFPEPDLLPVRVLPAMLEDVRGRMPVLPHALRERFMAQYGLSSYDAGLLIATPALAGYFEATVRAGAPAKSAANWIATELLRRLKESGREVANSPVAPEQLAALLAEVEAVRITAASAKRVLAEMFATGKSAAKLIGPEGLETLADVEQIEHLCRRVLDEHPQQVLRYRAGQQGVYQFFVGQVMRSTQGQADPQLVNDALRRLLGEKTL